MITYQKEDIREIWDDFVANELSHWGETEEYRHDQPFNPDRERYFQYADIGFYHLWSAREDGVLAGNVTMYVSPSMHTQLLIASEDTFYIRPEYRGRGCYTKLFNMVRKDLTEMGVHEVTLTAKVGTRAGKLLEHKGCTHFANQYSITLTGQPNEEAA